MDGLLGSERLRAERAELLRVRAAEEAALVSPALVVGLLSTLGGDVSQGDVAWSLGAVAWLRGWADEVEGVAVGRARRMGWGWSEIAAGLGRSRQAVWSMYRACSAET